MSGRIAYRSAFFESLTPRLFANASLPISVLISVCIAELIFVLCSVVKSSVETSTRTSGVASLPFMLFIRESPPFLIAS